MSTVKVGRELNNVLHAVLSLFTCGTWLLVWALLAMTVKPVRYVRVWVDEYGRVMTDDGADGGWVERMPATQAG